MVTAAFPVARLGRIPAVRRTSCPSRPFDGQDVRRTNHVSRWLVAALVLSTAFAAAAEPTASDIDTTVAAIKAVGGRVRQVKQPGGWEADFQLASGEVTDQHLQCLDKLPNLVALNLKGTNVTNAGLAIVGRIGTLRVLHLEMTQIDDAGLEPLLGLKELGYLNLYGTRVSDDGVQALHRLPKLTQLFVANTKVTAAAIERLSVQLPGLRIVPNPAIDRAKATAVWEQTKTLLAAAEQAHELATKDATELPPQADQLRKESEVLLKLMQEKKKSAEEAKKKADDVNRMLNEAKKRAEEADKKAKNKPDDSASVQRAEQTQQAFAKLQQEWEALKSTAETLKAESEQAQQQFDITRRLSDRASNAKKTLEDAKLILQGWQEREVLAREAATP